MKRNGFLGITTAALLSLATITTPNEVNAQTVQSNVYTGQTSPTETGVSVEPSRAYRDPAGADGVLGTVDDDLRPTPSSESAFTSSTGRLDLYGDTTRYKGAYSPSNSILPVEITSYTAVRTEDDQARLTWTAAEEQGIAEYKVLEENKYTGDTVLGRVPARGTPNKPRQYSITDDDLTDNKFTSRDTTSTPQTTYTVKAVNLDGSVDNTVDLTLEQRIRSLDAEIAPNPIRNQSTITVDNPEEQRLDINAYNVLGQRVYHDKVNAQPGTYTTTFDASSLSSGKYFLRVRSDDNADTESFTVIR